jgi:hypothetical protein
MVVYETRPLLVFFVWFVTDSTFVTALSPRRFPTRSKASEYSSNPVLKHIGIPSWVVRFVLPSFSSTSHGLMKKSFILKSVSHELVSNTSSCGSRFQF